MPIEIKEFVGEGNIKTVSDNSKKLAKKKRKTKKEETTDKEKK